MADFDTKAAGELIKSVGPTDDHRQKFGQTFFGSLLGQTISFVGMLIAYFLSLILLKKYTAGDLKQIKDASGLGVTSFAALIAVPPIFILLFSILPTAW